ncbi:unnamed protein product, partial [marine sediment metagenome]
LGVEEYDLARLVFKLEERGIVPTKATETKDYEIEETYLTIVDSGCRVNVPLPVRVFLGVEAGDKALIIFNLEKRRISRVKDVSVAAKPEVVEPEPEPEIELPQEQIYENVCPQGLSYPLQNLNLCQSRMCSYFKRKQGEHPAECIWLGWEETDEEDKKDVIKEETWYDEERDRRLKKYLENILQDELEIDAEMGFYRPKNVILRITPIEDQEELFAVEVLPHGERTRIDVYVRATDEDLAEVKD